jgi:5-methylcytosine-specific restriction endonuclease McrA
MTSDPTGDFIDGGNLFAWHLAYQETDEFKADEARQVAKELERMKSEAYIQGHRESSKRYRDANPDLIRMRAEAIKHKPMLYEQQQGKCYHCGKLMGDDCEIDHIDPLIRSRSNKLSNLCVCHHRCNRKKGAKVINALKIDE